MCLILIALDQFTKYLAVKTLKPNGPLILFENIFEFRYLENHGAAFGILQGKFELFIPLTIIMCGLFLFAYVRIPYIKKFAILRIVLCFMIAGAVGNFIDRVIFGYVIDFIYFKLIDFPIFNVADIYITCSSFVFAFLLIFYYKEEDLDRIQWFKRKE